MLNEGAGSSAATVGVAGLGVWTGLGWIRHGGCGRRSAPPSQSARRSSRTQAHKFLVPSSPPRLGASAQHWAVNCGEIRLASPCLTAQPF